jgi:hypothetical protein
VAYRIGGFVVKRRTAGDDLTAEKTPGLMIEQRFYWRLMDGEKNLASIRHHGLNGTPVSWEGRGGLVSLGLLCGLLLLSSLSCFTTF